MNKNVDNKSEEISFVYHIKEYICEKLKKKEKPQQIYGRNSKRKHNKF